MKPGIHPNYRYVVFQDTSSGDKILTRSTIESHEMTTWTDGNEYPLAKVEISAFTHPFFTGQMKIVDTAGRVERFERRYGRRKSAGTAGEGTEESTSDESAAAESE
ncbi:MAG TPA: type B 50S ribosomal protein L31 [Microthrixaceae bacterium]|nr:type B 50S ribosomal protein L31 [Microthrixaceae bacterium]